MALSNCKWRSEGLVRRRSNRATIGWESRRIDPVLLYGLQSKSRSHIPPPTAVHDSLDERSPHYLVIIIMMTRAYNLQCSPALQFTHRPRKIARARAPNERTVPSRGGIETILARLPTMLMTPGLASQVSRTINWPVTFNTAWQSPGQKMRRRRRRGKRFSCPEGF